MADSEGPKICQHGGKGMLFPLVDSEHDLPTAFRAVLYACVMVYLFLAVNIVADKFMASVETITSVRKIVYGKDGRLKMTKIVWNGTVANLTLLALGSSAPEILLSIVETVRNDFYSGELGPSTIVGSAAFNLFIIVGTCIVAIPAGESRKIAQDGVFIITAIFSLLAYLWMVIIVQVWTPDTITIEEGLITLCLFPILTLISYWSDKGYLNNFYGSFGQDKRTLPLRRFDDKDGLVKDIFGEAIRNPAGVLTFLEPEIDVSVGQQDKEIDVFVMRRNGTKGTVKCKYSTEKMTAEPGRDYDEEEGELTFDDGEEQQAIKLTLLSKEIWESDDRFQLCISEATGGAIFNPNDDGGEDRCRLTVNLRNENLELATGCCNTLCKGFDKYCNVDNWRNGLTAWSEDIQTALCEGFQDEDFCNSDCIFHAISLPWKLGFTILTPPAVLCGGWLCFSFSLLYIGCLTAIIIDFAELFGCVTTLKDSITAITFVALGTSMPDLFASLTAAADEDTADASIVNVTGSNSVNVFLGIGIPWFLAAVVWAFRGATDEWKKVAKNVGFLDLHREYENTGGFVVMGGDLGFSVTVFTVAALIGLAIIRVRRFKFDGELGGPSVAKWLSGFALALLWCFYLFLSIWKAYNEDADSGRQVAMILIALYILALIFCFAAILTCLYWWLAPAEDREPRGSARALKEDDDWTESDDDGFAEVGFGEPLGIAEAGSEANPVIPWEEAYRETVGFGEPLGIAEAGSEANPVIPWEEAYRETVELETSGRKCSEPPSTTPSRSRARFEDTGNFNEVHVGMDLQEQDQSTKQGVDDNFKTSARTVGSSLQNHAKLAEDAKGSFQEPGDGLSLSVGVPQMQARDSHAPSAENYLHQPAKTSNVAGTQVWQKEGAGLAASAPESNKQLAPLSVLGQKASGEANSHHGPPELCEKIQGTLGVIQQVKKALGDKAVIPVDDPRTNAQLKRTIDTAQACKHMIGSSLSMTASSEVQAQTLHDVSEPTPSPSVLESRPSLYSPTPAPAEDNAVPHRQSQQHHQHHQHHHHFTPPSRPVGNHSSPRSVRSHLPPLVAHRVMSSTIIDGRSKAEHSSQVATSPRLEVDKDDCEKASPKADLHDDWI